MKLNLSDTVIMMNSRDYRDRFVAEYIQTKIRYERLKAFCNRIEAAKLDPTLTEPKHDCPYKLLRKQQSVMGEYLHQLELRAVIEDIDIEDAVQYVEEQATRVREAKEEEIPFEHLDSDEAIIREAVGRVLRANMLTDADNERVFCAVLRLMDELDRCKCATVAKDIPSTPDPACTCCQSEGEPPCEKGIYGESEGA